MARLHNFLVATGLAAGVFLTGCNDSQVLTPGGGGGGGGVAPPTALNAEMTRRLQAIEQLPPEDREAVKKLLDAFLLKQKIQDLKAV